MKRNNYFNKAIWTNSFTLNRSRLILVTLISTILFLSVASCKKDKDEVGIKVNIKNISNYDFTSINFEGKEFGDLKKGQESKYITFDKVYYNLAYVKLFINGIEFKLQPIDYDAPELTVGSCTYLIDVINYDERRLSLETPLEI